MKKLAVGISLAVALLLGTKSYAQSDMDQVRGVIDAYHDALNALDAAKMESLWAHDDAVMLINPASKGISVGWDAVKANWEATFNAMSELKVTLSDGPHIQVKGDMAWSVSLAQVAFKLKSGVVGAPPTFETDVLEKRDNKWQLVSHAALRMAQ
jgi:uncharacterized protein (TIGR02246 family)